MEQIKKGSVLKAAILSFVFACATALCVAMPGQAWAADPEAKIDDTEYATFDAALGAAKEISKNNPDAVVTITLLKDVEGGFNVGNSKGTAPQKIILDLNTHIINAQPGVGSNNQSNGIRVLYKSSLTIMNGTVTADDDKGIGIMIANYGTLTLDGVVVEAAAETDYTINNRGDLTLKGKTIVEDAITAAITNDPYNMYIPEKKKTDAVLNVADSNVTVGKVLVELYGNDVNPDAEVVLNISAGTFRSISDDSATNTPVVTVKGNVSGGTFTEGIDSQYLAEGAAVLINKKAASFTVLSEDAARDQAEAAVAIDGVTGYFASLEDAMVIYEANIEKAELYNFTESEGGQGTATPSTPSDDAVDSKESEKSSTPKTGDAAPFAAVAGIAALAIAGVAIARRQMI